MDDLHNMWSHRWINPKAKSINSTIEGLGVVAVKKISRGEIIAVLGGIIVPKKDIDKYHKIVGEVGIQINDNFFITPTTRDELKKTGVFNHSCNPNCGFSDSITFVAIKDINPGEEIVFDYAFCESYTQNFKCKCKSKECRGRVGPNDWKIKELQEKYFKFFSPYIKDKIIASRKEGNF